MIVYGVCGLVYHIFGNEHQLTEDWNGTTMYQTNWNEWVCFSVSWISDQMSQWNRIWSYSFHCEQFFPELVTSVLCWKLEMNIASGSAWICSSGPHCWLVQWGGGQGNQAAPAASNWNEGPSYPWTQGGHQSNGSVFKRPPIRNIAFYCLWPFDILLFIHITSTQ